MESRRVLVRHHGDGQRREEGIASRAVALGFVVARPDTDDLLAGTQKQVRHLNALLENAAGISAHVEDNALDAFFLQTGDGRLHLLS